MDITIQFAVTLRKKDVVNYALMHYFKRQKALNIFFVGFFILLSFYKLIYAFGSEDEFVFPISIIFNAILYIAFIATFVYSNVHAFGTSSMNKYENKYTITENSIMEESIKNKTILEWSDIRKVFENKKLFTFYISSNQAYVFPKDQIDNDIIINLRKIVSQKMEKKKRKLLNE